MPLRFAIVDDEAPARMVLREYLSSDTDVQVVAECANGFEAVKAVAELHPDLLFLDVQMPKLDGFEVHAVDYLLKPFGRERLLQALGRVRERLNGVLLSPQADVLRTTARRDGEWLTRIVIRDSADVHVIPIDRVDYVEAQDDYVAVHAGDKPRLKEQTLASLEGQLDPRRFVRIHRSYLLNLDRLARLESVSKDARMAILRDGRRLPVSRAGFARLQELL